MKRAWVLAVLTTVGLVGPAPAAEEGDLARLQGRWEAKVGPKGANAVALEIKGRKVAATIRTGQGLTIRADGELRIDEGTSPKTLDWVKFTTEDGAEVPELLGIYRLEGDRLEVRSGGLNNARPTGFEAGDGEWAGVLVFGRADESK